MKCRSCRPRDLGRWRHPFDETERLHRNAGGDVMRRLIRRHPFDETSRVVALKC